VQGAFKRKLSGISLKDDEQQSALSDSTDKEIEF
jgi:hypothetical protein